MLDILREYMVFLAPVVAIQLILMIVALVSVLKADSFKRGNKVMWIIIVIAINIIGPIIYFAFGRGE